MPKITRRGRSAYITTPAGSLVDVLGRMFAEDLGARLGQSFIVDNRPGGMTQIGVEALNRAPPDGYTLMIGTSECNDAAVPQEILPLRPDH